ncbi:DNA polymerase Y family protein [Cellulosimicrobium cellulans]|uniref:DNA polymerase Y family protein n=1 Tax=Cellulosimicrobium cellulans TaxID=1710 RepID=UPI00130E83B8|nr:DNA polymerase Y family protein [Cellulosimicrobium cellulans]
MSATRTTVVWVPDWPVVAAVRAADVPGHLPAAVQHGPRLVAVSAIARAQGVRRGMRRRQAQGVCPEVVLLPADDDRDARLFEPVAVATEAVVAGIEVARPGLLLLPAGGAARFHGTEETLAERLVSVVAERTGHECQVGTADGLLAAILAARTDAVVPPGASREFLAPRPVDDLAPAAVTDDAGRAVAELVDLLRRLGLRRLGDLAALDGGDVHARFGTWGTWAWTLVRGEDLRPPARRRPETDLEVVTELDPPAHRVDVATFAGRRLAEELHALLTEHSVTCARLRITARTDEGTELTRAWRTDMGGLGGLSAARITDRIRWQLEGWLTAAAAEHGAGARPDGGEPDEHAEPIGLVALGITAEDVAPAGAEQGRLWGGASGGDLRAHRALDRVQGLLGGDGVLTAALQGGRDVRDQVHLQPWGAQAATPRPVDRPWPGQLPPPAPATVPVRPAPVDVLDGAGRPVRFDGRFAMSGDPVRVRTPASDRRPAVDHDVAGWAGPWPLAERWWSPTEAGLRVHLQVTLGDGRALLLAWRPDGWTCEAVYD